MSKYSTLSNKKILDYLFEGEIVIDPFNDKNLNTNSYDVTLGEWYFREQPLKDYEYNVYNIYSQEHVEKVWGKPIKALPYSYYLDKGIKLENIKPDEKIIFIDAGETILAHTNEFIGGVSTVTSMMKARSSIGRNFLKTCSDAGLGDIGYTTRWTMEITNSSRTSKIPLVVGRRIAQIVFFETDGVVDDTYIQKGKYQNGSTLEEQKKNWKPEDMLPKMYKDFENFI